LKRVTTLIFDKAVLEPTFCAMYAQLCYDIHDRLPKFPPEPIGSDDDEITFMRVLLNTIQMLFDGTDELSDEIRKMNAADQKKDKEMLLKLRTLGNLRLVGELFLKQTIPEKIVLHFFQELLSHDEKTYPSEEKLEAVCVFLKTIGKKLDGSKLVDSFLGFSSKQYSDYFFRRLKSLSSHPQLSRRIKFLVRDIFDLRSNNWIPSGKESSYYPLDEHHM
ncbi:PREDICTED: eukaryotic translation initiation factor-like, partial [Camelina sativa]|uniref:Eukaryotic translation initiation factor-like n=1 Tax=Camelina sativa TaxID=90675 RepID=A0ABM0TUK0_CAMSA